MARAQRTSPVSVEWSQGRLMALSLALQRRTAIVLAGLRPDNDLWV